MQSVPITTNIVSPNPAHVEFVSDLRVSGGPVASTNKTDRHDITEILLKVALYTITLTLLLFTFVTE
jgi:hypothetical protein